MKYVIKTEIPIPTPRAFEFARQKTMYGGKNIAVGDTVFVFASEHDGGQGLLCQGVVTAAQAVARKRGVARQTPRNGARQANRARQTAPRPGRPAGSLQDWGDERPQHFRS